MRRTVSEPSLARHTGNVRDSDRCIGAAPPAVATGAHGRRSPRGAEPHAAATKAASAAATPPSGISGTNTWTGKKPSGSSKARTRPWCGSSAAASPARQVERAFGLARKRGVRHTHARAEGLQQRCGRWQRRRRRRAA